MSHPLEDEDVLCSVTLEHVQTRVTVTKHMMAPADGPPDVQEAVEQATRRALDELLANLESRG